MRTKEQTVKQKEKDKSKKIKDIYSRYQNG